MDPIIIILVGIATVLFCIIILKLHAAISLLLAGIVTGILTSPTLIYNYALHSGMSVQEATSFSLVPVGKRLAIAFGNTSAKIGILIAFASIIGVALMRSGAAERIIRSFLKIFGKKNTDIAFLSGSFTLAIPVFFDTVFYLMIPLVKSLTVRNPKKIWHLFNGSHGRWRDGPFINSTNPRTLVCRRRNGHRSRFNDTGRSCHRNHHSY